MFRPSLTFAGGVTGLILLIIVATWATSCDKDPAHPSEWQSLAPFPGNKVFFTAAASGSKCFLFFGVAHDDPNSTVEGYRNDVWMYDADRNEWSTKNNYDGDGRYNATAFATGSHIYIVGGRSRRDPYPEPETELNEFLKYTPASDTWMVLDPFPGQPRSGAMAFVINDFAYYGLGSSNTMALRDLWQYNTTNGIWRQLPDFPGGLPERFLPSSIDGETVKSKLTNFAFNNRIVLIAGVDWDAPESWTFDTSTEQWYQNDGANFEDADAEKFYCVRSGAASIQYKGDGYVALGTHVNQELQHSDVVRYSDANNSWKYTGTSPGASAHAAFSFVYKDGIIIGTEYNRSNRINSSADADQYELWMYRPGLVR